MRKPLSAALGLAVLALVLSAAPQASNQAPPQPKPEDVLKNLVKVEKPGAAPEAFKTGFDSITAADSIAMLSYLSSDLLEGRETATRGYRLAAEYAGSLMKLWGLQPGGDAIVRFGGGRMRMAPPAAATTAAPEKGFLQDVPLQEVSDSAQKITLELRQGATVRTQPFASGVDYTGMSTRAETLTAPVVFVGYGLTEKAINWDELKGMDLKGKIVVALAGAPGRDDPKSPFQTNKELKDKYFPQGPDMMRMMMRGGGGFNKPQELTKLGAAAVLQVPAGKDADMFRSMAASGDRRPSDDRPINTGGRHRMMIPGSAGSQPWERSTSVTITRAMADAILANGGKTVDELQKTIDTTGKPASMVLPATTLTIETTATSKLVHSPNVVGFVPGSDPALKNEVVVIGAHLDHLGAFDQYVYNGADDNGSGSVGVLNAAHAMAVNPRKPKRTVVFALWTGEEEGLLGSRWYVKNPAFPEAKTIAYYNLDMISRPYDERTMQSMGRMFGFEGGAEVLKSIKPANFLPVSFSDDAWIGDYIRAADAYVGLDVFLRKSEPGPSQRGGGGSDHSSFGGEKIPWVASMAAMTEDYHQTSDSVDKVSGDLIARVSKLAFATIYAIADK